MNDTIYSSYKGLKWKDRLDLAKEQGHCPPVFAQIFPMNPCNFNCQFCYYSVNELDGMDNTSVIKLQDGIRILKELKDYGAKAIEWSGGGEPTLHPQFNKLIRKAETLGLKQALVTNGSMLHKVNAEILDDFSWIRVSINAVNKDTYLKVHGVTDKTYDSVMTNVKNLLKRRKRTRKECVIGMSFIVYDGNYKEILQAAQLAKSLGFDNVRFSLAMTPKKDKIFDGIWDNIVDQLQEVKKLETDKFKVFTFSNRIKDLSGEQKSKFCWYHHLVLQITPNGYWPCCRLAGLNKYKLGELNEPFSEMWEGQTRKVFTESISKGCPVSCWMTQKNKFLDYVMGDNAQHVEFI